MKPEEKLTTFFRFHAYDDRRGGLVSSSSWMKEVKSRGYKVKSFGGINWYCFKTNCPVEECQEILIQLTKKAKE